MYMKNKPQISLIRFIFLFSFIHFSVSVFAKEADNSTSIRDTSNYFAIGTSRADEKDYAAAIIEFDKAIQLNPEYAEAFMNRGASKMSLGKYKEALIDLNIAITLAINYPEAYKHRGTVKFSLKDTIGAIADISKAIEMEPTTYYTAYQSRAFIKNILKD